MPKKAGIAIATLGAALILSALLLFLYNQRQAEAAGQEAEILMSDLESWMQEQKIEPAEKSAAPIPSEETEAGAEEPEQAEEMPAVNINSYEYVGYVEIPALGLKLPVLSEWDYDRLRIAPCCQHGSSRTDDLVIAAHNYRTHFGRLGELTVGDTVTFTDMDGIINTYAVVAMDTIDPYDVGSVLNSEYDLVLYTCTLNGESRVTAFCSRAAGETADDSAAEEENR